MSLLEARILSCANTSMNIGLKRDEVAALFDLLPCYKQTIHLCIQV